MSLHPTYIPHPTTDMTDPSPKGMRRSSPQAGAGNVSTRHPVLFYRVWKREGDSQGWSTVLVTALGSWGETVPREGLGVSGFRLFVGLMFTLAGPPVISLLCVCCQGLFCR
jgi:hypothetical protein